MRVERTSSNMSQPFTLPYRLDTAASFWPLVRNRRFTSVFRLAVEFDHRIVLPALQKALLWLSPRFPGFAVHLRQGVFWSYFEPSGMPIPLAPEEPFPCVGTHLVCVIPWHNRLAVEFSHVISDGTGALTFLSALACAYLDVLSGDGVLNQPASEPAPEEWENAFLRYAPTPLPAPFSTRRAFQPRTRLLPSGHYRLIHGLAPTADLKQQATVYGLKVGEYLIAILMAVLQDRCWGIEYRPEAGNPAYQDTQTPDGRVARAGCIRILVPVDLRRISPSPTLRNFFSYIAPEIDPRQGYRDFAEVAQDVRWQMRGALLPQRLRAHVSQQVRMHRSLPIRLVPSPLKTLLLALGYPLMSEARFSASLSNLGVVTLPKHYDGRIRRFLFAPPPSPWTRTNCSVISWGEETAITFGSTDRSRALERAFFVYLRDQGVRMVVFGGTP